MADQMRNRLVYTVFSPKEEGARDLLLAGFREAYPEASDEDYQLAVESADNALAYADNLGMDLALAPRRLLQPAIERAAIDKFHRDEDLVVDGANVEDVDDIRVR